MSSSSSMGLKPTIDNAICMTTLDGLLIFELTLRGQLDPIRRRPHDRERAELVQSGNVFLFNDVDSGIKRWTDGITWSPSRIMGNYLIYRELAQPFPPGEKKKAQKRVSKSRRGNTNDSQSPQLGEGSIGSGTPVSAGDTDRNLVGSLVDSYGFKSNGLVKKTLSIKMEDGRLFHLISYYRPDDVYNLHRPESLSIFHGITVRPLLMDHHYQGFRVVHEPNPPEYNQSSYQNNPSAMSASSSNHSTSFGHLDTDVENTTSPVIDPRFAQSQYARPRLEIAYQESSPHNQFEAPYNAIQHYAPSSERGYNPHVSSFPRFTDGHQSNIAQEQYSSYEDSHHIGSQPRYRPPLASDNTSPIAQRPSNLVDGEGAHPHSTWHTTLPHPHTSISHAAIPAISGHASYPHMGVHLPVPSYQNTYHDTNATSWSEQSDTVFHEGDHSPGINLDVNHDNTQPYAPTHPRADPSHPYWRSRQ